MARYKITLRRRKAGMETFAPRESIAEDAARITPEPTPNVTPRGGKEAAFKLYEEFFADEGEQLSLEDIAAPEPVEKAPEEKPVHTDLIDPESVEPTREFDLSEVRDALKAQPQKDPIKDASVTPAEADDTYAAMVSNLFSTVFPEEKEKRGGLFSRKKDTDATATLPTAASAPIAADPTVTLPKIAPAAPLSADATIPVPDLSEHAVHHVDVEDEFDTRYDPNATAELATRATIADLIENKLSEQDDTAQEEKAEEFDRPEDADGVFARLKKKTKKLRTSLIGLGILFLLSLYLESVCFPNVAFLPRPEFLTPGRFGTVLLLCDLQLIVLAVAASHRNFFSGMRALFSGKAGPDSLPGVASVVSFCHLLFLLVFARGEKNYMLFGCVAIFLLFAAVLRELLEHRSTIRALNVLATDAEKFAATRVSEDSAEIAAFAEHIGEEVPEAFSVSRTDFVTGFSTRTEGGKSGGALFTIGIPVLILLSVGVALWCYLGGPKDTVSAVGAFVSAMMMGLPACAIFSVTIPFFFAQRKAAKNDTALIGEGAVEECSGAEIVSFDDTEVFLPKHVKVTSVRTYGAARIDKILIYCAQVFRIVGGPLSFVFENSISSLSVPGHVEILENDGNGICARIDGHEIYLGNSAYMEAYEFAVEIDDSDATYENKVGRIMYLAVDDELAAKFYIKYAVSAKFVALLRQLNRAGIYAAVKTCDPNIDTALLAKILHSEEFPVGVVKTESAAKNALAADRLDAPIAGVGKISGVLNGFLLCEAVRSRAALGGLTKFVSMFLGLFITFVLAGMQNAFLTPVVCLIYQCIWLLPIIVPSLFDWPTVKKLKPKK